MIFVEARVPIESINDKDPAGFAHVSLTNALAGRCRLSVPIEGGGSSAKRVFVEVDRAELAAALRCVEEGR